VVPDDRSWALLLSSLRAMAQHGAGAARGAATEGGGAREGVASEGVVGREASPPPPAATVLLQVALD
jgi:hypothetical protein